MITNAYVTRGKNLQYENSLGIGPTQRTKQHNGSYRLGDDAVHGRRPVVFRFHSAWYFSAKNYLLSVKQTKSKCSTNKITHLNLNLKKRPLARRVPTSELQL